MSRTKTVAVVQPETLAVSQIDTQQSNRAVVALLKNIQTRTEKPSKNGSKKDLLDDADGEDVEDEIPVWLVLTTKKHIVDQKRLKPGKIALAHPILSTSNESLRICLITADPQRMYKDLIADPTFPSELGQRINRVIGLTKLKAKYKSFEARRQLLGEYDVFLADDRVITYLPGLLGKTFYQGGSKRPIPVDLQGKKESTDAEGNKRRKLADGGTKAIRNEVKPQQIAKEVQRALDCTLVHLAPSTTTAVKVGKSNMKPEQISDNIEIVVSGLVDKYVPQKWKNVRSIHIKGPNTAALPIWMTSELWADEKDVLEEAPAPKETKKEKKRKRALLAAESAPDVIEVPGPDGVMRKLAKPSSKGKSNTEEPSTTKEDVEEKIEKRARASSLKQKKEASKAAIESEPPKKKRAKAADLV